MMEYIYKCPICKENFTRDDYDFSKIEDATTDCHICGGLLMIKHGELFEFHSKLNELSGGHWPEDGKGTGFIEFELNYERK